MQTEVKNFLHYKRVECGFSPLSIEAYGRALSHFSTWFRKNLTDAQRDDVRSYLGDCREAGLSTGTVNQCISALREFYKHLLRDRIIERDPMLGIELLQREKRLPKALTEAEMRQLLDAPDDPDSVLAWRDKAILETFYATAGRVSEIASVELAGLDLAQRVLSVIGKGSKQRLVPLGEPAAFALRRYINARSAFLPLETTSPFLFLSVRGKPLTRQRVWQIVRESGRRANLSDLRLHPHALRHSCATHMAHRRADLRTVQSILGHADIRTTQIYLKVWPTFLRDELLRCHPRNNPARHQLRLFSRSPVLAPGPAPCEECAAPTVVGRNRCEEHLVQARIARGRHYAKKKRVA